MKDLTNVLYRIKPNCRLVGKPPIKVVTVYPYDKWDGNSIEGFAKAATAWRTSSKQA